MNNIKIKLYFLLCFADFDLPKYLEYEKLYCNDTEFIEQCGGGRRGHFWPPVYYLQRFSKHQCFVTYVTKIAQRRRRYSYDKKKYFKRHVTSVDSCKVLISSKLYIRDMQHIRIFVTVLSIRLIYYEKKTTT